MSVTRISRHHSISGNALAQILVAAGMTATLGLLVAEVVKYGSKISSRTGTLNVMFEISRNVIDINKDISRWMNVIRDPLTQDIMNHIAKCLPPKALPSTLFDCPLDEKFDDTFILAQSKGRHVTSINLMNVTPQNGLPGTQIAGTVDRPLFFDSSGRPCDESAPHFRCSFKTTGYMIRQNLSGFPGEVDFILKIEHIQKGEIVAPLYQTIRVGTAWRGQDASFCPASSIAGLSDNGLHVCFENPSTACPHGQVLTGWNASGESLCVTPSPPAYANRKCSDPGNPLVKEIKPDGTIVCGNKLFQPAWRILALASNGITAVIGTGTAGDNTVEHYFVEKPALTCVSRCVNCPPGLTGDQYHRDSCLADSVNGCWIKRFAFGGEDYYCTGSDADHRRSPGSPSIVVTGIRAVCGLIRVPGC